MFTQLVSGQQGSALHSQFPLRNEGIYESTDDIEPHQVVSVTVYKQLNVVAVVVVVAVVQLQSVWIMTAGAGRPGCSHRGRHGGHRHNLG